MKRSALVFGSPRSASAGSIERAVLDGALLGRAALLGAVLLLGGCGGVNTDGANSPSADTGEGDTLRRSVNSLPDFELDTLDGSSVALSDHLGKEVILVDFWATFCDPCLVAMPHLNDLYEKYRERGFVILGVSVDGPESVGRVRSEVRKLGVTFPILLDQETEALALYNPKSSAPFSVLIDRQGHILKKKEGFTPTDVPELESAIEGALAME